MRRTTMIKYSILGIAGRTFLIWELDICTENYGDRARRVMEDWECSGKILDYMESSFPQAWIKAPTPLPTPLWSSLEGRMGMLIAWIN